MTNRHTERLLATRNQAYNGALLVASAHAGPFSFVAIANIVASTKKWTQREVGYVLAFAVLASMVGPLASAAQHRFGILRSASFFLGLFAVCVLLMSVGLHSSSPPWLGSSVTIGILHALFCAGSAGFGVAAETVTAHTVPASGGDRALAMSNLRSISVRASQAVILVAVTHPSAPAAVRSEPAFFYMLSTFFIEGGICLMGLFWMKAFLARTSRSYQQEEDDAPGASPWLHAHGTSEPPPSTEGEYERMHLAWVFLLIMNIAVPISMSWNRYAQQTYSIVLVTVVVVLQVALVVVLPKLVNWLASKPVVVSNSAPEASPAQHVTANFSDRSPLIELGAKVATASPGGRSSSSEHSGLLAPVTPVHPSKPRVFAPDYMWWIVVISAGVFIACSFAVMLSIPLIPYSMPLGTGRPLSFPGVPADIVALSAILTAFVTLGGAACLLSGWWFQARRGDNGVVLTAESWETGFLNPVVGKPLLAVLVSGFTLAMTCVLLAAFLDRSTTYLFIPIAYASIGVYTLAKTILTADLFETQKFGWTAGLVRLVGGVTTFVILLGLMIPSQESRVASGWYVTYGGQPFCLGGRECFSSVFFLVAGLMFGVFLADVSTAVWWRRHQA